MSYEIHERFSLARKNKKISKAKVAEMMNLSRGVIDNIELKRVDEVKDLYIDSFCTALNVNKHWLRTGEGEMYADFTEDEEIANYVMKLMQKGNEVQKNVLLESDGLTKEELETVLQVIRTITNAKKNTTPK